MSLLFLALTACGTSHEATAETPPVVVVEAPPATPPVSTPSTPTSPTPTGDPTGPDTWTIGVVDAPQKVAGVPAQVASVRSASHEGFDRIVWEFKGDRLPGHHLEYVDRPARDCGAGTALEIAGDALLLVQFTPASAHDDAGASTTEKEAKPALANVREIERTCDFEGVVAFVVGVGAPNPFRVFELTAPARLVVDVKR
ncbi:MAG: hypothetical protein V4850_20395 [Myxococcota bacterium]